MVLPSPPEEDTESELIFGLAALPWFSPYQKLKVSKIGKVTLIVTNGVSSGFPPRWELHRGVHATSPRWLPPVLRMEKKEAEDKTALGINTMQNQKRKTIQSTEPTHVQVNKAPMPREHSRLRQRNS